MCRAVAAISTIVICSSCATRSVDVDAIRASEDGGVLADAAVPVKGSPGDCPLLIDGCDTQCTFSSTCYYGQECCCGTCYAALACLCVNGKTACYYIESCQNASCP